MWMLLEPNGPRPERLAETETSAQQLDVNRTLLADRDAVLEAALAGAITAAPFLSNDAEADTGAGTQASGDAPGELPSAGPDGSESSNPSPPTAETQRKESGFRPLRGKAPAALRSAETGASVRLCLYMHPGRVSLGERDSLELAGQFDLSQARLFDSVSEAEREAQFGVGFLIEVREPFLDEHGIHRPSGCYFSGRIG